MPGRWPWAAKGWRCPRCQQQNDDAALTCSSCGLIRGAVVPEVSPSVGRLDSTTAVPPPPNVLTNAADAERGGHGEVPAAPPAGGWAPPAGSSRRRLPIGWIVAAVFVLALAVGGWYFSAGRSSTGEIEKAGDLAASELRVGDCFDLKDPTAEEVGDVTARPCAEGHEYEVFLTGDVAAETYPTEATFTAYVEATCLPAFESYVGTAYLDSDLDVFWIYPTEDAWNGGDHSVQCTVYHPRIHSLTGSLKGSQR